MDGKIESGIVRVRKDQRYFVASNVPFNDKRLSWEARGVMGYLLSKPNDWETRMADLVNNGPAGLKMIRRILAELRQYGYMHRETIKVGKGRFMWVTTLYESPELNLNMSISPLGIDGVGTDAQPAYIVSTELTKKELSAGAPIPDSLSSDKTPKNQKPAGSKDGVELRPEKMPAAPKPAPRKVANSKPQAKDFPGVDVFRATVGRYPNAALFDYVSRHISLVSARLGRPTTADDLKPFLEAWVGGSCNPMNLAWLTEWAVSGEIRWKGKPKFGGSDSGIAPRSIR